MYRRPLIITWFSMLIAASVISCSSSRKIQNSDAVGQAGNAMIYESSDLMRSSVSADGFFIRRLHIVTEIEGKKDSYTANLRKSNDGKWLASIQLLRIEVFRVFADKENVVLLDRLGRTAYIMTWEKLGSRYGLTYELLPAILGDIPHLGRQEQRDINCNGLTEFQRGNVNYYIIADCNIPRAKEMIIESIDSGRSISVRAEEFGFLMERYYTSAITVKEKSGAIDFSIFIDDITIPWAGDIDFSIPENYKIER